MSKSILISIKPKWVAKILNGEKTIEIRKTMPKCDLPIDVYIYCTNNGGNLVYGTEYRGGSFIDEYGIARGYSKRKANEIFGLLNGKVIAKFTLKHIDNLSNHFTTPYLYTKETCLTWEEILNYRNNGLCYAWHISNLEIFDEPKHLCDFWNTKKGVFCCPLTKAPQSWCYVEVVEQ